MSAERYVPVSELPTFADFDPEVHRMSWDFSLPPTLDTERIFLDQRRLRRLQTVAAFSSNHVSEYRGDRSEYDIAIAGIHADGTAIAGRAKRIKEAETGRSRIQSDNLDRSLMIDHFKASAFHELNRTEISSRVADTVSERGISREKAWVQELNNALEGSINAAASKHLVERSSVERRMTQTATVIVLVGSATRFAIDGDPWASVPIGGLASLWITRIGLTGLINKKKYGTSLISELRWSINPYASWQPDRYLATVALNSVTPLIRYRK